MWLDGEVCEEGSVGFVRCNLPLLTGVMPLKGGLFARPFVRTAFSVFAKKALESADEASAKASAAKT